MTFPDNLRIGDILLYNSHTIVDDLIDIHTGSDVAHIEIYIGNEQSVASRNGIGSNIYRYRPDGLVMVRRLVETFDLDKAMKWFQSVKGTPYNWESLGEFFNLSINGKGFICSTLAAYFLKYGGIYLFAPEYSLEKISPRDFKLPRVELKTIYYNV